MKRFTETSKWSDPWFRKLSPELKNLWHWLLDNCDNAGVIEPDLDLASFQIGYQYPMDSLSKFGDRLEQIPCGKYYLTKFINFQCGVLSEDCKAHRPIFQSLEKHFPIGYPKGIHTLKEKEKEKDYSSLKENSTRKDPKRYATFEEVTTYGMSQPLPISQECIDAFFDRMEEIGWVDDKGLPLADWKARFRRYATNWINNRNSPNKNFK